MKYFTIGEMLYSNTAVLKGINNYNTNREIEDNMIRLIESYLDPIRDMWGKPIWISSGYRTSVLNREVGGSTTSMHMRGLAADLNAGTQQDNVRLFEAIAILFDYDQLINEDNFKWVHFGIRPLGEELRKQVLQQTSKGYRTVDISTLPTC